MSAETTPESPSKYTPTTGWLRIMVGYAKTTAIDRTLSIEDARAEGYEWFDRWLAAHDAEVARNVLTDAADAMPNRIFVTKDVEIDLAEHPRRFLRARAEQIGEN